MKWLILTGIGLFIAYLLYDKSKHNKKEAGKIDRSIIKTRATNLIKLNAGAPVLADYKLGSEQSKVFKKLENTSSSSYVTGRAGTGKSMLLQYFVNNTTKVVAVLAPTGIAALNVGGQTIHSFFKFPPSIIDLDKIVIDYNTKEMLMNIDAIVIDEVSMVSANLMEAINRKMQLGRGNSMPFGGIQVIMFGDLYQLPPVVTDGELHRFYNHTYGGIYFFNAPVFKDLDLQAYELQSVFRQSDPEFKDLLERVRNGSRDEDLLNKLNERHGVSIPEDGYLTLAGTNSTVSSINHRKLTKLDGDIKIYDAKLRGDIKESAYPTEMSLKLKVGAQIMLLKNDTERPPRWVNGTLGIITELNKGYIKVSIDGIEHSVGSAIWKKYKYYYDPVIRKLEKEEVASFEQLPIRLAWAITIHKSQGRTYESVAIDLTDGAFAHGQTYVALSRCKSFDKIYLLSEIKPDDIIVDQDVVEFMDNQLILK